MRWKWMTIGVVAAGLASAPAAQAADYTVTGTADVAGACTGTQCTSVRAALSAVSAAPNPPDTVTLQPGTYQLASALVLDTPVALRGGTARDTTLTAAPGARALLISANAAISHLTISGGSAPNDSGGDILARGATVTLDQMRVTNGRAGTGGGVANRNGTMTITNSLIDGNAAEFTGGTGDPLEAAAGGIANVGDATLGSASLTVRNSTVTGNTAFRAGGILSLGNDANALTLENVTVANNTAGAGGTGGIYAPVGTFSLGSSILAGNTMLPGGETSNCGGNRAASQGWNVETSNQCLIRQEPDQVNVANAGLAAGVSDLGGETDVLAPSLDSPAVNIKTPGECQTLDQRGVARPQGPSCDSGAVELAYPVRIDFGPSGPTSETSVRFTFSSSDAGATFECALDTPSVPTGTFAECAPNHAIDNLGNGDYTLHVRAIVDDQPIGETKRAFTVDTTAPTVEITSAPSSPTKQTSIQIGFTSPDAGATFQCTHTAPGAEPERVNCTSPWTVDATGDGTHGFAIVALDAAGNRSDPDSRSIRVDTVAPAPVDPAQPEPAAFSFTATEDGGSFECRLDGPSGDGTFSPCTSPKAYPDLAAGDYRFTLRTVDAAGNHADAAAKTFSIAATPTATVTPTEAPAPAPAAEPAATPVPTPQAGQSVVVRPSSGKILVRRPGSTEFVEIEHSSGVPLGSEIDARKGKVVLTAESVDGKPVERATFYAGLFIVQQSGAYIEVTLSEELAACKKKAASAAAAKPKTRKLWGDGKGKFRTKGQYSAATVRGTKWLVEDSCDGTLTRVAQGVVSVRDVPKRKTVLLRAGRSYLANPPKK